MNLSDCHSLSRFAAMGLCCLAATSVLAQQKKPLLPDGYPSKPIRIICSSAPGAGLDIVTRGVAVKLSERLGTTLVVDNQGGGTGAIGINMAAAAVPDGYTILSTGGTTIINAVFNRFERDMRQTLTPVVRMSSSYYSLLIPVTMPAQNFREFIAYARARPGKLNYGSNGVGSVIHLGMKLLEAGAGLDMVHVPYKGGAQANIDFAAGRLDVALTAISGMQVVKLGKARVIATTLPQRSPEHPEVPTIAESGIPGFEVANTYMLYAPVQTPPPIIAALNREAIEVLRAPDMKQKLAADGAVSAPPFAPDELKKLFLADYDRWEGIIKKSNLVLD